MDRAEDSNDLQKIQDAYQSLLEVIPILFVLFLAYISIEFDFMISFSSSTAQFTDTKIERKHEI